MSDGSAQIEKLSASRSGAAVWLGLVGWLAISFLAALVGSRFTPGAWYETLQRPTWAPPNAVFGPVWTVLYVCMGIAAWRVWKHGGWGAAKGALALFLIQLALNATWSWLFFGLHRIDLALLEILVLLATIALTIAAFRGHDRVAAWLMVPYAAWVAFASFLNFAFWQLNRS